MGSESHVEGLVDFLCKDEDLAISGLPDSIKHEVFSLIVSQFLSTFLKTFYDTVTSQNLMGLHGIVLLEGKELRISKILEEIEEEEGSGREPVAIDAIEDLVEKDSLAQRDQYRRVARLSRTSIVHEDGARGDPLHSIYILH